MFTDNIVPIITNGLVTIGGNDILPKGIGTVSWYWTDYEGKIHTKKLNNIIYSPYSPVNILSATALDESIKDDEETWVPTKRKYYIFTWEIDNYKKTIAHSEFCLPELEIKSGFIKYSGFF